MTALTAPSRAVVDRCHALALAAGGTCEGPPGLRPHYHPAYYGAYFRDLDGNKLCVVCHEPEEEGGQGMHRDPVRCESASRSRCHRKA